MPVDIHEYSSFVKSVQIVNVYTGKLCSENFMDLDKFYASEHREYKIAYTFTARLAELDETSSSQHNMVGEGTYTVGIRIGDTDDQQLFALVTVKLVALYLTSHNGSSSILDQFAQMNLPLNLWPYAREIINNQTMRMGVPPITLGVYQYVPSYQ